MADNENHEQICTFTLEKEVAFKFFQLLNRLKILDEHSPVSGSIRKWLCTNKNMARPLTVVLCETKNAQNESEMGQNLDKKCAENGQKLSKSSLVKRVVRESGDKWSIRQIVHQNSVHAAVNETLDEFQIPIETQNLTNSTQIDPNLDQKGQNLGEKSSKTKKRKVNNPYKPNSNANLAPNLNTSPVKLENSPPILHRIEENDKNLNAEYANLEKIASISSGDQFYSDTGERIPESNCSCSTCEENKALPPELRQHYHKCNEGACNRLYKASAHLQHRYYWHHGPKPLVCDYEGCKKSFVRAYDLVRHTRVHTGIRPYACLICNKKFTDSGHLASHRRTHTGEKRHQCPSCGRKFAASSNLRKHMKTHPFYFHEDDSAAEMIEQEKTDDQIFYS